MAQSEWGSAGPIEVYSDAQWDPMQGWEQERHYRGYPSDLVLLGNSFIAAGWRARTESTGSQWARLIVSIPNDGNEDFIDRYEFNVDFKQQELWLNLEVVKALRNDGYADSEIFDLIADLKEFLSNNTSVSKVIAAEDNSAVAGVIYQMMLMGQEYVEVAQPVLARKRTYDIAFNGTLMSTRLTQDVYSTANLIETFGIPPTVADQIVADPASLPIQNYQYGWKMRKNNLVIIPSKNKIEEQIDWVWDQWSTVTYNFVG